MPFRFAENDRTTFASIATELPYSSGKKTQLNKRIVKIQTQVIVAMACLLHREERQKRKLTTKNKRSMHMGHIKKHNKIRFMESYTKYLNNVEEEI